MSRQDFVATTDAGKADQFNNFASTFGNYADSLEIPDAMITGQAADAAWFSYILDHTIVMKDSGIQWVNYKNLLLDGTGTTTVPVTPSMPETLANAVNPGIIERFRELARLVKAQPGYSMAMGEALGIVGPEQEDPDPMEYAPEISLRKDSSAVTLLWKKGRMDGLEVQCDRGTSTFATIATSLRPDFRDPEPFPAAPATWRYRAVYILANARYGQWSNTASITVGG